MKMLFIQKQVSPKTNKEYRALFLSIGGRNVLLSFDSQLLMRLASIVKNHYVDFDELSQIDYLEII